MQGVWILENIYHIIGSLEKNKTRYSVIVFETPRERQNLQFLSGKKKLHEFKREKKKRPASISYYFCRHAYDERTRNLCISV